MTTRRGWMPTAAVRAGLVAVGLVAAGLVAAGLVLDGCTSSPDATPDTHNPLATWVPSTNFGRRQPVIIVLHYTQQDSAQQALDTLRSENWHGPVSAHYLVGDDGRIYQLVADLDRSWHAGVGRWGPITDLNDVSIGIELDNDGVEPYTDQQFDALVALLGDLTTRLGIDPRQVIGHSDLAPTRKIDPGPRFPWQRLHDAGFGIWPDEPLVDPPDGFDPWLAMATIGYSLDDRAAAVRAFHLRFRGIDDGLVPRAELGTEDRRILFGLSTQLVAPGSSTASSPASNNPSGTVTVITLPGSPTVTSPTNTIGTNAPDSSSNSS